jgi:hypothetical protein
MREILFRGKRVDNGEWVDGYYYKLGWQSFIRWDIHIYEVFPESVGQFTGLLDNNEKKIFQGDVVYLAGYGDYIAEFPFLDLYQASYENDIGSIKGNIHEVPL